MKKHSSSVALICVVLVQILTAGEVAAGQNNSSGAPDGLTVLNDVECGKGGDQVLKLDLAFSTQRQGTSPCVLLIHGGAWRGGRKDDTFMTAMLFEFAKAGYVVASVQYRLCPKHPFPAQVEDVKCAVRFLRAHAGTYQIDSKRFGAVGFSAGAHLAMMLGATNASDNLEGSGGWADQNSQVQAVVSFFGPTDLAADDLPEVSRGLVRDFLGGTLEDKPDAYRQASPVNFLDESDAPLLMFQGTKDPLVPHTQVYRMTEAMTKAGVPGRAELLFGAAHGWLGKDLEETKQKTFEFLDRQLKK